VHSHCLRG